MHTGPENEKWLLLRVSEGNEEAFAQLYHTYRDKIYSLAFHITRSVVVSEEIVQDSFMKVWQQQARLPEIRDFDAWLFIIARNHIYTALKKMARETTFVIPDDYDIIQEDDITSTIDYKQFSSLLSEAVNQLPPQQYKVYHLLKEEKLSRDDAAAQLGLSPETVKVHLARAMRTIRAYMTVRLPLSVALFVIWRYL